AELEAFAQLGTDLDAATQARLDRGYAMNQLLIQGICQPLDVIDQVFVIYAGTKGFLDEIPLKKIQTWEKEFLLWLHEKKQSLWDKVNEARKLNPELTAEIEAVLTEFNKGFDK
ncbi:MAG: F0F1 ATP synthase subunit alpha, partial [Thermoguttaceae bacterium]|nr:F0F1 ATP synthase subunit alpha [Thermoguttaceae bacterium]